MEILETIELAGGGRVDLCQGDLVGLARNEWFDALVVSAFSGDYAPTQSSLIGALDRKGVSVAELSRHKDVDDTEVYGTWLSEPVRSADPGIGFGRVICFEPMHVGSPPEVVGHLFRSLVPIVAVRPDIRTIAMPIVASGDMRYSVDEMLPPILDAAVNSIQRGLPLDRVAIVVRSAEDAARGRHHFESAKVVAEGCDVFVSYSQKDGQARDMFVAALEARRPRPRVFVDQLAIDHGASWQRAVFESLERCHRVVCLLTPNYLDSDMCLDEFNIAWMRSRKSGQAILRPLYVAEARLPTWIQARQYRDCREFDAGKLRDAATEIAEGLYRIASGPADSEQHRAADASSTDIAEVEDALAD